VLDIHEEPAPQFGLPAPQQIAPPMAQQPALLIGKLRGEPPEVFNRDRTKSKVYKQQFCVYRYMNPNHKIMATPYYHIMQHLAWIRGPLVDDWKDDQIQDLIDKTTQAQNPVARDDKDL
jgi:hypothetical protein